MFRLFKGDCCRDQKIKETVSSLIGHNDPFIMRCCFIQPYDIAHSSLQTPITYHTLPLIISHPFRKSNPKLFADRNSPRERSFWRIVTEQRGRSEKTASGEKCGFSWHAPPINLNSFKILAQNHFCVNPFLRKLSPPSYTPQTRQPASRHTAPL